MYPDNCCLDKDLCEPRGALFLLRECAGYVAGQLPQHLRLQCCLLSYYHYQLLLQFKILENSAKTVG